MNRSFEGKIQAIIERVDPVFGQQMLQRIDDLRSKGRYSFEGLVAIVRMKDVDTGLGVISCWLLGQLGDKRAIDSLVVALKGSNVEIVQEAAKSLAIMRSKKAVPPLIELLLQSRTAESRRAAVYALGLLGDKRAYEPLLHTLTNSHEVPDVRGHAAEALASLRDQRSASALISALEDPSVEVRFWSAFALGQLKEERAIPALERLVAKDRSVLQGWGAIREEAAKAINEIRRSMPRRRRSMK